MVQIIPQKDDFADIFRQFGSSLGQSYMSRSDDMSLQKSISALGPNPSPRALLDAVTNTRTYSPESKQRLLENYLGVERFEQIKDHAREQQEIARNKARATPGTGTEEDRESLRKSLIEDGYPEYLADIYVNPVTPPGTKNAISAEHREMKQRGLREIPNKLSEQKVNLEQDVVPEKVSEDVLPQREDKEEFEEIEFNPITGEAFGIEEGIPKKVEKSIEEKGKEWPKLPIPPETTPAEREKWRTTNQKENNRLLREVKDKNNVREGTFLRLHRLMDLNESGKLPKNLESAIINPNTGEPYAAASLLGRVNKETQDFAKTLNDFMADAKSFFGGRVTNFELSSFRSRLPTLLNSEEGRRIILEQMRLMEQLHSIRDRSLADALKHYGRDANYSDIQNEVDKRTVGKEQEIKNKFYKLDEASQYMDVRANDPERFKGTKLMQSKEGHFKSVPDSKVEDAKTRGYIQW